MGKISGDIFLSLTSRAVIVFLRFSSFSFVVNLLFLQFISQVTYFFLSNLLLASSDPPLLSMSPAEGENHMIHCFTQRKQILPFLFCFTFIVIDVLSIPSNFCSSKQTEPSVYIFQIPLWADHTWSDIFCADFQRQATPNYQHAAVL